MPNILAIETSFPAASIALQLGEAPVIQKDFESHRQQNQLLFPPLQQLLEQLPDNQSLDLIIVGTGPGSYSGSRISIAAAQGIATVHACPVVGQSSFLATDTWLQSQDSLVVGDARRGAFFATHIPAGKLPPEPQLHERPAFDAIVASCQSPIFTLDAQMSLTEDQSLIFESPTAEKHILAWRTLSPEDQSQQKLTPPSPTYLRAPFITKAKPGHPLLRGKVKGQ
ncbi:tRNA (adenosine(37)-N6)-threonylcarbamoyltransferase complex dimerization subunit type 1 TsaB [Rubritalea tangerina]|uniref:tRNA (Adenosine(37)-N6)-threonylcarbamoyltransferase complex dimerization subunit type 1 TsaB n=1 Tax=Rubritalea tangerina TaxID=430798 RepID=A0ABW4ZC52_9BACT